MQVTPTRIDIQLSSLCFLDWPNVSRRLKEHKKSKHYVNVTAQHFELLQRLKSATTTDKENQKEI